MSYASYFCKLPKGFRALNKTLDRTISPINQQISLSSTKILHIPDFGKSLSFLQENSIAYGEKESAKKEESAK